MTENKRFRTGKGIVCGDYFSETIIDTETNEKYYGGIKPNYISSKEIVNLLNQLYEENQTLKQDIENLEKFRYTVFENMNKVMMKRNGDFE